MEYFFQHILYRKSSSSQHYFDISIRLHVHELETVVTLHELHQLINMTQKKRIIGCALQLVYGISKIHCRCLDHILYGQFLYHHIIEQVRIYVGSLKNSALTHFLYPPGHVHTAA